MMLVDELDQEFLFVLIDLEDLRGEGGDNGHHGLGIEKGFPFDLVVEFDDGNVVPPFRIHRIKDTFNTQVDEMIGPLLKEFGFLFDAINQIYPKNKG